MHQRYTQLRLKYLFTFINKCYYIWYTLLMPMIDKLIKNIFFIFLVLFFPTWQFQDGKYFVWSLWAWIQQTGFVSLNFILLTNIKRLPLLMYIYSLILHLVGFPPILRNTKNREWLYGGGGGEGGDWLKIHMIHLGRAGCQKTVRYQTSELSIRGTCRSAIMDDNHGNINIWMLAKSWAVREWVPQSRKSANSLTHMWQFSDLRFADRVFLQT